ncbi:hypothetical protein BDV26DRAFT_305164 [Aspergillus bertholletiae]|uniref:Uncharacterized protein n=1 Tax=Aspergillus bertholletiae TaxID=1226010 RepID=A0A5N7B6S0_9EURO|nr:hypothetical protein BDV26DRAFT_305164 [Aspergillus bertholletiae]
METPQEPSLLEYARFYGIACDFTAVDPFKYIDETASETPLSRDILPRFQDYIYEKQKNVEDSLRKEKLNIKKESARFLASVIQDARAENIDINWGDLLPNFSQADELKVQLPILNENNIIDTLQYTSPLLYDENMIKVYPLDESGQKPKDEEITADFLAKTDQALKDVMPDKLQCNKESMLLIQKARDFGSLPFANLEGLVADMMISGQEEHIFSKSPPLLISDVDKTYYQGPTPALMPLMLPSPTSSGSFELGLHCSERSTRNSDSKTSDSVVSPSKGEGGLANDEQNQPEHQASFDQNKGEQETLRVDSAAQFPERNRIEEQGASVISQQTSDTINLIDPASPGTSLVQQNGCNPAVCTSTPVRSSPSPSVIIVDETCQITSKPTGGIFSPSAVDSPNPDSTQYHDIQSYPMSSIPSSWHPKPEDHASDYLYTVEYHRCTKDVIRAISDKELESTDEAVGGVGYARQPQLLEHDTAALQHESDKTVVYASSDTTIPSPNTSLDTVSNSIICETLADTALWGQKRRHKERQDGSRKDRKRVQPLARSIANDKYEHTLSSQSPILGSLSIFMETRGRVEKRQGTDVGPYFTNNMQIEAIIEGQGPAVDARINHGYEEPKDIIDELHPLGLEQGCPQYPQLRVQNNERHLPFIKRLEQLENHPAVIYRDYEIPMNIYPSPRTCTPAQTNTKHNLPKEADIIVSPTASIILTTLQATTQLYLPGHKPSPQTNGAKCVNSPLRERIFLLAPRYRYLYVLVAQGTSSPRSGQGNIPQWTADKRLLASFTSLIAFCDSMSAISTISPVLISPSPDTLIGWVLALAHKHAFKLPPGSVDLPQTAASTPVCPTPKTRFDIKTMENETHWELFLRRAGLNPYAAQTILTVLRHERAIPLQDDDVEKEMSALSRFIERSPERRRELFPDLIG